MVFIFTNISSVVLYYITWNCVLTIIPLCFSGRSYLKDFLQKIIPDDFIVNLYYYHWISLFYAVNTVLFLSVVVLNKQYTGPDIIKILKTSLFTVFFLQKINYWNLNSANHLILSDASLVNMLLFNSINKYHPLILYVCASFVIVELLKKQTLHRNKGPWYPYYVLVMSWSLFLGSWWAQQEGSWGGWWNWDPSETFGLLILIHLILASHSKIFYKYVDRSSTLYALSASSIIISYVVTQLNFSSISHNFDNLKDGVFFVQNYIKTVLLIVVAIISYISSRSTIKLYNYSRKSMIPSSYRALTLCVWTLLIIFLVYYPLASSIINCLNYFKLPTSISDAVVYLSITSIVHSIKNKANGYYKIILYSSFNHDNWNIITTNIGIVNKNKVNLISTMHLIILVSVLSSLITYKLTYCYFTLNTSKVEEYSQVVEANSNMYATETINSLNNNILVYSETVLWSNTADYNGVCLEIFTTKEGLDQGIYNSAVSGVLTNKNSEINSLTAYACITAFFVVTSCVFFKKVNFIY